MIIREAEKAGSWYPADAEILERHLQDCLELPIMPEGTAVAAIVPHAGLAYSGPVAGKAYAALVSVKPETVLIFGAVHTMAIKEPAVWAEGEWATPMGNIQVDETLAEHLCHAEICTANNEPHYHDNAIELQMPFIRYCFPRAKIVPIAIPPQPGIEAVGAEIWKVVKHYGKRVVAIGSSDLTHYGASFGFTPAGVGMNALAWAKANDRKLIDLMLAGEAQKIIPAAYTDRSACGSGAIAVTVAYANAAGAKGELLEQTTSYDILPDGLPQHFVGYASVVFYSGVRDFLLIPYN
ncbi:MAG: AmmeMemoRadiSam system protein B [Planctomycetes bacterium]|nr:AmmeMemoRadiSam system protein B [Planctomycetota bacterium]